MNTLSEIDKIVEKKGGEKKSLISILQAIQQKYNYLPEEALKRVSEITKITPAEIISVASFFSRFRFQPAGKHLIKVCIGTACHVKGSVLVYDSFRRVLKLGGNSVTDKTGTYTVEKVSCLGCCTLAPVVQIDHITYGHVTPGQVNEIIADFESVKHKTGKKQYRRSNGNEISGEIRIGLGSCCVASGSDEIRKAIEDTVSHKKLNIKVKHVGCVGMCHQVPLVEVVPCNSESFLYAKVKAGDVDSIIQKHFKPTGLLQKIYSGLSNALKLVQSDQHWDGIERYSIDVREKRVSAFLGNQIPIATEQRGVLNPLDLEEYIKGGGFDGLKKALSMKPADVIEQVKQSGIRGRGGGGFPTGIKWQIVAAARSDETFLICNGDEGDPGAFMDRMLLESYPFRVIEGVLIAAYAVGSKRGFFYIRAEYPLAVKRIKQAMEICSEAGLVGNNILSSSLCFSVQISEGAGAFVCGEETALVASIEGKRGFPKKRPPFPAQKGLWGKPTLVNNTETFSQIPYIMRNGAEKFISIGTGKSRGTKVFALAGKIARGGLIEVPMGITVRKVVEEIGGGIAGGKKFKAVQIGGPSGGCVPYWLADTPIDYLSLNEVGAMMGSGGLVVLDESDCMVDIAKYFLSFTQNESCGKCTFCRIGTKRMLEIMEKITTGKGTKEDIEKLETLAIQIKKGSLCGLGKSAPNPVLSTLKYFRDEYLAHIEGHCPAGKCKELITYSVNDNCIGCTICAQHCPVEAITFTPREKHTIDTGKCIRCDTCRQVCPEEAITVR